MQAIFLLCSKKISPNTINNASIDTNLQIFSCQSNNLSNKQSNDNESLSNCKYRDINYIFNLDVKLKSKCLSPFILLYERKFAFKGFRQF